MRNFMRALVGSAALLTLAGGLAGPAQAQPKPDDVARPELLYKSLQDVINYGATLYNAGDYAGCYRLYQGSLIASRPFLIKSPELLKQVDDVLVKAESQPKVTDRAFALRAVLDNIREYYRPGRKYEEKIPDPKKIEIRKEEVKSQEPKKELPKPDLKKDADKQDPSAKDVIFRQWVGRSVIRSERMDKITAWNGLPRVSSLFD